ncbi:MAG: hypothetical protein AAFU85_24820 [Planctomycetota bacterium]
MWRDVGSDDQRNDGPHHDAESAARQQYNPYQAPLESALDEEVAQPRPSHVIGERFEFAGTVTRQHCRDAMRRTDFRGEVWTGHRTLIVCWALLMGICTWWIFARAASFADQLRVLVFVVALTISVAAIILRNRWLVGSLIPDSQLVTGPIRGWLDGETLCIETDTMTSFSRMDALFSTAHNNELMVLNFGSESVIWTVLPFDFFPDPMAARTVAEDLHQLYPPKRPLSPDTRKREPPTAAFLFERPDEAVGYEGPLKSRIAKGSRFSKQSNRIVRHTLLILLCSGISIAFSGCFVLGFGSFAGLGVLAFCTLVILLTWFRRWNATRRTREDSGDVIWQSRGWLDETCYCSMTDMGQAQMRWQTFDHHETTEQMIVLYPHSNDFCGCLIGRNQFANEADWEKACRLVRQHVAAHPEA